MSAFTAMRAIVLAESNANNGSALLCVSDARECFRAGNLAAAHTRALRSLAHSVGIFSEVYKSARVG